MTPELFRDFLCFVLFERNDFGTSEKLLESLTAACAIDHEIWNRAKRDAAFNAIADKAPLSETYGFCLTYEAVPGCIRSLTKAYEAFSQATGATHVATSNDADQDVRSLSDAVLLARLQAAQEHNPATGFFADVAAAVQLGQERARRARAAEGDGSGTVQFIDMQPTWGQFGVTYARLAESGETRAVTGIRRDLANAMSFAQAFLTLPLTPQQKALARIVHATEMKKQGFDVKKNATSASVHHAAPPDYAGAER